MIAQWVFDRSKGGTVFIIPHNVLPWICLFTCVAKAYATKLQVVISAWWCPLPLHYLSLSNYHFIYSACSMSFQAKLKTQFKHIFVSGPHSPLEFDLKRVLLFCPSEVSFQNTCRVTTLLRCAFESWETVLKMCVVVFYSAVLFHCVFNWC